MAEKVGDTIDIEAAAGEIFAVASDYDGYPEWQPNVKKVEVRETNDEGRATIVHYEVDVVIRTVQYTLEYDYSGAPESFSWSLVEGDLAELRGRYAFDEFEDVTEVSYELAIDPGFKVPGMLRRRAERTIVSGALKDLKRRVESAS